MSRDGINPDWKKMTAPKTKPSAIYGKKYDNIRFKQDFNMGMVVKINLAGVKRAYSKAEAAMNLQAEARSLKELFDLDVENVEVLLCHTVKPKE